MMDALNQETIVKTVQPIAIGPCMLFKRHSKGRTGRAGLWIRSLCARKGDQFRLDNRGHWVEGFLTLYSDSTMCLRHGSCEKDHVVASVKLVDVYRRLVFGEGVKALLAPEEVPTVNSKYTNSMLAVPTEPHCNSQMAWLFFFTQNTLNKWLVAFCRAIPAEKFSELRISPFCHHQLTQIDKSSPPPILKKHIRLFFPSEDDADPIANPLNNEEVKISSLAKRPRHSKVKKHPKPTQKGSRGSRWK